MVNGKFRRPGWKCTRSIEVEPFTQIYYQFRLPIDNHSATDVSHSISINIFKSYFAFFLGNSKSRMPACMRYCMQDEYSLLTFGYVVGFCFIVNVCKQKKVHGMCTKPCRTIISHHFIILHVIINYNQDKPPRYRFSFLHPLLN